MEGGMGQEREEWRIGRGREWRWRSRKKGSRMCETGYRTKIGGLDNDTAVQLKWMWKRGVKWPDSKSSIRLVCVEAGEWVRRNTHENKNIRLPTTEWYLFFSWIHLWISEKFRPNAFHHCSSSDRIVIESGGVCKHRSESKSHLAALELLYNITSSVIWSKTFHGQGQQ